MSVLFLAFCILGSAFADLSSTDQQVLDRLEKLESEVNYLREKDAANQQIIEQCRVGLEARNNPAEDTHVNCGEAPQGNQAKRLVLATEGLVAFTSKLRVQTTENVQRNAVIIFTEVDINEGAGYNVNTGVFTAPAPGIYVFSLSVLAHSGINYYIHGEIMHDGVGIARALAVGEDGHRDQGAVTVLAMLTQGAQVWVRSVDFANVTIGGDLFSVFSGYMIWQN